MEIFEILKENLQADFYTKINLIEKNFSKEENDFVLYADQKNEIKKLLCNMQSRPQTWPVHFEGKSIEKVLS